ncbi:metal-dependent hydrolase [Piscibacillus sp. B03]|uniref:metal-dependent hydrolase n=1 Tax=Piscibacillus sp. B03 TaxID=3457430 RepID=UPI003FCD284D
MMATGHQAMGITWGVAAVTLSHTLPIQLNGWIEIALFFAAVMAGSLLPDMDSMTSKVGRYVYPIAFLIVIASVVAYYYASEQLWTIIQHDMVFALSIVGIIVVVFSTHRTWTHSLLFLGIVTAYLMLLDTWLTIPHYLQVGLLIGIASHIFGDFLTKQGVPLLYPFKKRRYRFWITFTTGSFMERVLIGCCLVLNIWLVFSA